MRVNGSSKTRAGQASQSSRVPVLVLLWVQKPVRSSTSSILAFLIHGTSLAVALERNGHRCSVGFLTASGLASTSSGGQTICPNHSATKLLGGRGTRGI